MLFFMFSQQNYFYLFASKWKLKVSPQRMQKTFCVKLHIFSRTANCLSQNLNLSRNNFLILGSSYIFSLSTLSSCFSIASILPFLCWILLQNSSPFSLLISFCSSNCFTLPQFGQSAGFEEWALWCGYHFYPQQKQKALPHLHAIKLQP